MLRALTLFSGKKGDSDKTPGLRLADALQSLGPSFIKLGQILATRPDIVGDDVSADLTTLQDRLPPFPGDVARQTIEAELDAPVDTLFATFDDTPVAAASIAQVHRATTTDGRDVAVKVLRPNIEEAFARDIATFHWFATRLERNVTSLRRLRPVAVIENFADWVRIEMDLRIEAAAASELADNTADDQGYRVPDIDWDRTACRVLVTEWIDGIPIYQRKELVAAGHDMTALATTIVRTFLMQVMRDGFFHADLHQGNLFVDADSNIVVVDFGIMGRLDKRNRRYLAEILRGFHIGDYRRIAEIHFEAGFVPRDKSIGEFSQAIRAIGVPIAGKPLGDISFGAMLGQLFQVTETFEMEVQPQLLLLQKTMMMVEGLSASMAPQINMWDISPPIIEEWMQANMGPIALLREGFIAVQSLVRYLPLITEEAEAQAKSITRDGVRIHHENIASLTERQNRWRGVQTALLAVIAGLLAILAYATW